MKDQPTPHHCKITYDPDTDQVIFTVTENANQPKPATYNPELADVMLNEGDFEGLAHEVGKPNKPEPTTGENPDRVPIKEFMQAQWDKDNPATGEFVEPRHTISDHTPPHLKPATDEWTFDGESRVLDSDGSVICVGVEIQGPYIADAHNAALANEEKRCIEANADVLRSYIDQLAAERSKVKELEERLKAYDQHPSV